MIFSIVKAPCAAPMILVPAEQNTDRRHRAGSIAPAGLRSRGAHAVSRRRGPRWIRLIKQDKRIPGSNQGRQWGHFDWIWALAHLLGVNAAGSEDAHPPGSAGIRFCITSITSQRGMNGQRVNRTAFVPVRGVYNSQLPGQLYLAQPASPQEPPPSCVRVPRDGIDRPTFANSRRTCRGM